MQLNNLAEIEKKLEKKFATVQDQKNQANQVDGAAPQAPRAPGAPAAPVVHQTITADSSSKVLAPVISNTNIQGNVNFNS